MPDEIELKLAITPEAMQRLRRHPMLKALSHGPTWRRRLNAIYFDTADGLLEARGMSLRVRREGGRWTQTIKGPAATPGGLLRRLELECPVRLPEPDLALFNQDQLGALLTEPEREGPWVETVRVQVNRARQAVRLFDSDIVLAFDIGSVTANGRTAAISEVELELASGRPSRVYELAMMLADAAPFRLGRLSKLQQGLVLRHGDPAPPEPTHAAALTIDPASDPGRVFVDTVAACLAHLRANEEVAALGENPEGVHQARVAIRRLRALVAVYRDAIRPEHLEGLKTELRWLQGALGPARDWDVFLGETLAPLEEAFPGDPGLALLRKGAEAERAAAYVAVKETLTSARFVRLELRLALLLETGEWLAPEAAARFAEPDSLRAFAAAVLGKADRKMRKAGKHHQQLDVDGLHQVRILGKKLRYAGDFFESLYPRKPTRKFLKHLAGLQSTLGSLNDAAVSQRLLGVLQARLGSDGDAAMIAGGCGLVRGWQGALVTQDRALFASRWKLWRQAERFWTSD